MKHSGSDDLCNGNWRIISDLRWDIKICKKAETNKAQGAETEHKYRNDLLFMVSSCRSNKTHKRRVLHTPKQSLKRQTKFSQHKKRQLAFLSLSLLNQPPSSKLKKDWIFRPSPDLKNKITNKNLVTQREKERKEKGSNNG